MKSMMNGRAEIPGRLRLSPLWISLGAIYVAAVIFLSLTPLKSFGSGEIPFQDKAVHFLAYGAIMWWFGQIFRHIGVTLCIALGLIALGVALEFLQGATGYRMFEVADMAANTGGVVIGFILCRTGMGNLLLRVERAFAGPSREGRSRSEKGKEK